MMQSRYIALQLLDARRATTDKTPLQRRIEFVVRLVMALTVLMSGTILAQAAIEGFTPLRVVQITAVLSGLVPYGLFFLIAVAYTAGAARLVGRGALVQQVNAVESVSNVNVVCTDKTGTLTTGGLTLDGIEPLGRRDATEFGGALARSVTTPNLTTVALAASLPGTAWTVRDEVPFASSLRWSGVTTDEGTWVLGAADALATHLAGPAPQDAVAERAGRGLRVLLLAWAVDLDTGLRDGQGRPALPALEPVALVALADQLRPEVTETISHFHTDGVGLKVLRRRPAHRRRTRGPGRAGRGRAGVRGRTRRPRRRGAGASRHPHHRVRPPHPQTEGTDRLLAAPPGQLRRHDRRRSQRRPRTQGRPGRGGHAQRQHPSPATWPTSSSSTTPSPPCCPPNARAVASSSTRSPCRCTSS